MSGPPENVEAAELWRKLSESPRPSEVVDFPRNDSDGKPIQKIRIQVLAAEQHDEARTRAMASLKDDRKLKLDEMPEEGAKAILGDATAYELLALALVSVSPISGSEDARPRYARLFHTGEKVRKELTADEVGALFTMYLMVQRKFGPNERTVSTDEDLNAWVRVLDEGAGSYPLARLDSLQLAELATSLAGRIFSLSQILESQLSTLPDTFKSNLATWGIGTGFFGKQPEADTENGGERSSDDDAPDVEPNSLITPEVASEIARKLRR